LVETSLTSDRTVTWEELELPPTTTMESNERPVVKHQKLLRNRSRRRGKVRFLPEPDSLGP